VSEQASDEKVTAVPQPPAFAYEFHPLCAMFPLMSDDELDELAADIKKCGLQEPITLHEGKVLDGRNRVLACQKIGKRITQTDTYDGDDPAAFVISKNIRRRHLTQEQKREIVAKLLVENPERSDRATAKIAGVDHKTVSSVRTEAEERGEIPHVDKRSDAKGRKQPAHKAKATSPAAKPTHANPSKITPEAMDAARRDFGKSYLEGEARELLQRLRVCCAGDVGEFIEVAKEIWPELARRLTEQNEDARPPIVH
jgi:ParB-like chromosome segregation protein Spo0J